MSGVNDIKRSTTPVRGDGDVAGFSEQSLGISGLLVPTLEEQGDDQPTTGSPDKNNQVLSDSAMDAEEPSKPVGESAPRRSGRAKRPVPRLSEVQGGSDEEYAPGKKRRKSAPSTKGPGRGERAKVEEDIWDPKFVMQDSNSPLTGCSLIALIRKPEAWELLSPEEKNELLSLLPPSAIDRSASPKPSQKFLWGDAMSTQAALFQTDLASGRLDPDWLQEAQQAHEQRAAGKFDKFKDKEFEEYWGQKSKANYGPKRGKGDDISLGLKELVERDALKAGDILRFERTLQKKVKKKTVRVKVEKDILILNTSTFPGTRILKISYPPGEHVISSPHLRDDISAGFDDLGAIATAVIEEDGRWKDRIPPFDPWNFFRIRRGNQDLGVLGTLRWSIHEHMAQAGDGTEVLTPANATEVETSV